MKSVITVFVSIIGLVTLSEGARADAPTWAEASCGARVSQYVETVASDFNDQRPTMGPGLRSVTIRAVKKKTNILRVVGFDRRTGSWSRDFSWELASQTSCEGYRGRMCEGDSATVCVRPGEQIQAVHFAMEGSNSGRFEIRYGYR